MGANRGAIDAVVAAIRHDLSQCDRHCLPGPGFAPSPEPPIDRVPIAVLGRNIAPRCAAAKPPEYAVNNQTALFGRSPAPSVRRIDRQQTLQNTPFRFAQITPAQARLQKEALNQSPSLASTNLSTPPRWKRTLDHAAMSQYRFTISQSFRAIPAHPKGTLKQKSCPTGML